MITSICPTCEDFKLIEVVTTGHEIYSKCTVCGEEFLTPEQMQQSLDMLKVRNNE